VNRKADFFLQNESIRIDSHNESNRFESRIGMLYHQPVVKASYDGDTGARQPHGTETKVKVKTNEH